MAAPKHIVSTLADTGSQEEIWKDFQLGITEYSVSSLGRVRKNDDSLRLIKPHFPKKGAATVSLPYRLAPGERQSKATRSLSVLVAKMFLPFSHLPRIRYKDGNKRNCAADNLEYCDFPRAVPLTEEQYYKHVIERRDIKHAQDAAQDAAFMESFLKYREDLQQKTVPTPQPEQPTQAPTYPLSTVPQMDAHGNALPTPFPVIPEKLPEEDERDIEGSGLYFSQARAADKAYLTLLRKEGKTSTEAAAFKNLKRVLDYD